jgi:hypothetical protein
MASPLPSLGRGTGKAGIIIVFTSKPGRTPAIDPSWLAWQSGVIVQLARMIYDEHRFRELPVLADALEDAGCRDESILGHWRGEAPHARGCWLLDLCLNLT